MINEKNLLIFICLIFCFNLVYALNEVNYPVAELGNCESQKACAIYCDQIENIETCLNYAEKNNLLNDEEILEAKKILLFMKSGETPGACFSKSECNNYCKNEENLEECVNFAEQSGFISKQEAEIAIKVGGKGPGGCSGPLECSSYCGKKENFNQCIDFAEENNLIDAEEAEMTRKTQGESPGNCRGKEECNTYCKEHEQECIDFAEKYGLMIMNKEEMKNMGNEENCMVECIGESEINFNECKPGPEGEQNLRCKQCAEKCMQFYEGDCLTEEQWRYAEEECMSKGEHMEAMPVTGDSGQGYECTIKIECIDRSDEFGDEPGEGENNWEQGHEPNGESVPEKMPETNFEQDKLSITGGVVRDSYSENSLLLSFFKSIKKLFVREE